MKAPAAQNAWSRPPVTFAKPRLGFLGTGWIGRLRMEALNRTGIADFAAVYDTDPAAAHAAAELQPHTQVAGSLEALLDSDIDGVVIASPNALHLEHCQRALARGKAVFCQKPLGRNLAETAAAVAAARRANRLLAVDFCYRHLTGMDQLRRQIRDGELGRIFAAELTFHNAYGPDKPWFRQRRLAGGGCLMDLGIHLLDLLFWLLGPGEAELLEQRLLHDGLALPRGAEPVEDYAGLSLRLHDCHARLNCSWNLHAGRDAVISVQLHGSRGGAALDNLAGSFFDFQLQRLEGTRAWPLGTCPDDWGPRALRRWTERLAVNPAYHREVETVLPLARLMDRIYGQCDC